MEEQEENGCEGKIIVEVVINQDHIRETIGFPYNFSVEEFITDGPSPLKNDLFCFFVSGGIDTFTSLSYINNATTIASNYTLSTEYSPRNVLRFKYCLHTQPSLLSFEEDQHTFSDSHEEDIEVNIAIQHSLADNVVNFIPTEKSTVDSLIVNIFSEDQSEANSFEGTQCVICLDLFVIGTEIVTLDCGHRFDRKYIVKWLNTSHYCPICKFEFPI